MRANDVSTPVLLERTGGVADRAAAPTGRWSHIRDSGELLAAYGMAMASVAIFLRAPTGSLWQVGACAGLLFASAALWAASAATSTTLVRLRRRLDEAEERLTAQSDELGRYAAILSSTEDAIVTVSLDGLITHWNPAATELYGYARHDVLGRSFATLDPEAVPAIVETPAQTNQGGGGGGPRCPQGGRGEQQPRARADLPEAARRRTKEDRHRGHRHAVGGQEFAAVPDVGPATGCRGGPVRLTARPFEQQGGRDVVRTHVDS
jgi:PAS domain-containing protein